MNMIYATYNIYHTKNLAERTAEKLKKLTEEEFAGLVFLPGEDME